jgi:hypothetical protein
LPAGGIGVLRRLKVKVKHLMDILRRAGPDMDICISGYEGGLKDLEVVNVDVPIKDNYYPESDWWMGPHSDEFVDTPSRRVIILRR